MRKVIFSIFIVLCLLILGGIFFLKKFDADRFRPRLVQELEKITGNSVKLGKLSLSWSGGLALNIDGLEVFQRGENTEAPVIQLEKGGAVLQLLPLLQKQIKLASLDFQKPHLEIIRNKQGAIQIRGINPQAQPAEPRGPAQNAPAALPLSFFIGAISIKDGQVLLRDEMNEAPMTVPLRSFDLALKNVSLDPEGNLRADISLDAGLFVSVKNLHFSGKALFQPADGVFELRRSRGELDLGPIDVKTLEENIPAVKALTFQDAFAGEIKVNLDPLSCSPQGIRDIDAQIVLNHGRFRTGSLAVPIEEVDLKASMDTDTVSLESLSAKFAGGTAKLSGKIADWKGKALSELKADAENIALDNFLPPVSAKEPQLHGRIGLSFKGNTAGLSYPGAAQALSGEGKFALKDGVIVNFSILRNTLNQLSMFPGLVEKIEASLPENLKEKFKKPDTVFEAMEQVYVIRSGRLAVQNFALRTESFESKGDVEMGLDGAVSGKMDFSVSRDLSEVLDKQFPQMKYLEDSGGRVTLPVAFQGVSPKILMAPDLKEISVRLAKNVAGSWIGAQLPKPAAETASASKKSDLEVFDDFVKTASSSIQP